MSPLDLVVSLDRQAVPAGIKLENPTAWGKALVAVDLTRPGGYALQGLFTGVDIDQTDPYNIVLTLNEPDNWHPYPVLISASYIVNGTPEGVVAVVSPHDKKFNKSAWANMRVTYSLTHVLGRTQLDECTIPDLGKAQFIVKKSYGASFSDAHLLNVAGAAGGQSAFNHNYIAAVMISLMKKDIGNFRMLRDPIEGDDAKVKEEVASILGKKFTRRGRKRIFTSPDVQAKIRKRRTQSVLIDGNLTKVTLPDDKYGFLGAAYNTHGINLLVDDKGEFYSMDVLAGRGNLSKELRRHMIQQASKLEALAMAYRLVAQDPDND